MKQENSSMFLTASAGDPEGGFTLLETLVVFVLIGLVTTFGVGAVRHYWLVRSLSSGRDTVAAQLREVQQRSLSESHPNVYGVRFRKGTSTYGIVKYVAGTPGTCTAVTQQTLDGVEFANDSETDFPDVAGLTSLCRAAAPASDDYEIVFFYPRGSTNASSTIGSVKVRQPSLNRSKKISVSRLTGRVTTT